MVVPRKVLGGGILHAGGTFGEEQSLLDRLLNQDIFTGHQCCGKMIDLWGLQHLYTHTHVYIYIRVYNICI